MAGPLLPVEEALARVLDGVAPMPAEQVPLDEAWQRTLADDVIATRDQPPFDASAMDGYAVRGDDVDQKTPRLSVIGTAQAGHAFRDTLGPGQAVRIFTGAPLPDGADTVVIQENTRREGDAVVLTEPGQRGRHVRRRGLDFRAGDVLIPAGVRLNARHIGLAAAANHGMLAVRRRPRIAILSTGDELVPPGGNPRADQIISSNDRALAAFARAMGAEPIDLGIAGDSLQALDEAIGRGLHADVLVTIGGASVGERDLVQQALTARGLALDFWRIAMRPGKPLMFGRLPSTRVLGLPGNPVSALVCARIFLRPLIAALLGRPHRDELEMLPLAKSLPENDQRQDYLRARFVHRPDGSLAVEPFSLQDSSLQQSFAAADCLVIRRPFAPAAPAGSLAEILRLDF
ncbi:molybdopterin molybdotransferase MoeA [Rhodoligotrophos defluvii]|uniref:molybdopterin molybdotransferase MoeA n=1 Tax=Rhodoligotrophos defluvii TaxID=2561934 RepID=UPI0010C9C93A|nr:gephyrin-like molybdotransferase Glp [Rhodoligotrophos defluvii]